MQEAYLTVQLAHLASHVVAQRVHLLVLRREVPEEHQLFKNEGLVRAARSLDECLRLLIAVELYARLEE